MRPDIAAEVPALRIVLDNARRMGDVRTAANCLERLSWLAWVLLDGKLADECTRETAELAIPKGSPEAFRLAVRRAAGELQAGEATRALETLDAAERAGDRLDIDAFVSYLSVRADVLCALGETEPALECARLAFTIAQKRSNVSVTFFSAMYLAYVYEGAGLFDESQGAYDEASRIAERGELSWESAFASARAAWVAYLRGDDVGARERLNASLRTNERTPWLEATRGYVGLQLGLVTGDQSLVETFFDEELIDRVLASRDAYSIGRTLGVFYDYYRFTGAFERGEEISEIALARCNSAACLWHMLGAVAKFGDEAKVKRAQALLDAFPDGHRVASAYGRLFQTLLAERRGDVRATSQAAGEAFLLFETLGAKHHASIALVLAGRFTEARARLRSFGAFGTESRVAERAARGRPRLSYEGAQHRREIFALLLEGRTVKEIARQLGLSERTVKSRVSEIYARTGTAKRGDLAASMTSLL